MRRLQFGDERWYRAVTPEADPRQRQLIGYSQNLRALVMHGYKLYLRGYAANTGPINGWASAHASTVVAAG